MLSRYVSANGRAVSPAEVAAVRGALRSVPLTLPGGSYLPAAAIATAYSSDDSSCGTSPRCAAHA